MDRSRTCMDIVLLTCVFYRLLQIRLAVVGFGFLFRFVYLCASGLLFARLLPSVISYRPQLRASSYCLIASTISATIPNKKKVRDASLTIEMEIKIKTVRPHGLMYSMLFFFICFITNRLTCQLVNSSTKTNAQLNHFTVVLPQYPFSQTNHAYAAAELPACAKFPLMAHFSLELLTHIVLGGVRIKSSLRFLPSKN